jgi:hypothetical protein
MQSFPPLDIDKIARDLQIEEKASQNGSSNEPSSDSIVEDSVEGAIFDEIERRARKSAEEYRSQIDLYEGRIRRAVISTDLRTRINVAGESALTDFKVQALDDLDHLHNIRIEVEGRAKDFETFRTKNKLIRQPKIVSRRKETVLWLTLAIIVILESTLNGLFFAEGSETGLIGGVTQALVLSLLNVGVAILCARFFLPWVRHVHPAIKIAGISCTLFYVTWLIVFNFFIGHFRDLFIQSAGNPSASELLALISTSPLHFANAQSLILVLLGIAMSLASLIDGIGMDDNYPGYGSIRKSRDEVNEFYADKKAQCLAGLTQRRDSAVEDMLKSIEEMRSAEHELRLAIEGRSRLHNSYCSHCDHLYECLVRLHQRYREANTRTRTSPVPIRFKSQTIRPTMLSYSVLPNLTDLDGDIRSEVIKLMERFVEEINRQFMIEVKKYETVAYLTTNQGEHNVNA